MKANDYITVLNTAPTQREKSFYGKALVLKDSYPGVYLLRSYNTIVAMIDPDGFHRLWSGWSATTARHVNAFLYWYGSRNGLSKREWLELPVEELWSVH